MTIENPENSNGNHKLNRNWVTAVTFLTILIFVLILNAQMVAPFVLSLLMGGILAILFFPMYQRLREKNVGPNIASGIVTFAAAMIIILPLAGFTLIASKQASTIAKNLSEKENISIDSITQKISSFKFVQPLLEDEQEVKKKLTEGIQQSTATIAQILLGVVGSLPDRILQLILAMLACFFFLMDGRKFVVYLNDKIPLDGDVRTKLYGSFKNTAVSVIWATVAAAAAQAAVMFVAFLILGVPGAFLAGGATFIFAWIPILGSLPVWVAGSIYLYTKDQTTALIFMVIFGIIAGLIDNYVRPLVLKGRDELHPLVSLVSIFGGIAMFGIVGVFFGPLFAASLIALLQIWPTVGKRFGLTFDPPIEILLNKRKTDK